MDGLGWARELIDAPDLEALGAVIHGRLQSYTAAGAPITNAHWPSASASSTRRAITRRARTRAVTDLFVSPIAIGGYKCLGIIF